jgi:murein DD-endopeptidase MepM/ murein hydrolase activator NlpD
MLSSRQRSYRRAVCALAGTLVAGVGWLWLAGHPSAARAARTGQLQQQIGAAQGQISSLSSAISAAAGRVARLNVSIAALQGRINRIQADLDTKRALLLQLRAQLEAARLRLAALQAFEAHAEHVLSQQLLSAYEGDRPDIVSVVLQARGFNDLLERLSFAQRIRKQSVQIVQQVRAARRAVAAQATRLGALEVRQQAVTNQVLVQRNALAQDKVSLVQQQIRATRDRSAKANRLAGVRGHVAHLQRQLARLQAAAAAAFAASVGAGQVSSGGGFTFPLPKGAASPPGTWTLDDGVDIAAPGGVAEIAVCSGTIVLHGIGGFGPWTPVLHCDSSVGGYNYVYYGHAGPAHQLAVGTHVGAGQVITEVGPGIVGMSTGPHLEIGFSDGGGSPLGPGTASAMRSLLQGAYGG